MKQEIILSKGSPVFPKGPDEFVGKIVEYEEQAFLLVCEVNHNVDTLNGERLYNPRRNKFWGSKMQTGEWTIICIEWYHFEDFERIKFYEPKWSIIQTHPEPVPKIESLNELCQPK